MKKTLGVLLLASGAAFGQSAISSDDLARGIPVCEKEIKARLKDPDSAKIDRPIVGLANRGVYYLSFYVNAKNGFGGYAGEKSWGCRLEPGTFRFVGLTVLE